jgi:hypothetical protein
VKDVAAPDHRGREGTAACVGGEGVELDAGGLLVGRASVDPTSVDRLLPAGVCEGACGVGDDRFAHAVAQVNTAGGVGSQVIEEGVHYRDGRAGCGGGVPETLADR